jgi:DNA-binding MarR family transcriptional regulator
VPWTRARRYGSRTSSGAARVDRRSVRIKLTEKGGKVRDIVDALFQKHVRTVEQVGGISSDECSTLSKSLHERFWTDHILYRL